MKIKMTLAAIALTVAPNFALAMEGCGFSHVKQSASLCTEGQTWSETLGTCVATPSS